METEAAGRGGGGSAALRRRPGPTAAPRGSRGAALVAGDHVRRGPTAAAQDGRRRTFCKLPVLGARSGPWIELTLVDGTIVRIPQQNLAALQTVFTILRGGEVAALAGEVSHA